MSLPASVFFNADRQRTFDLTSQLAQQMHNTRPGPSHLDPSFLRELLLGASGIAPSELSHGPTQANWNFTVTFTVTDGITPVQAP